MSQLLNRQTFSRSYNLTQEGLDLIVQQYQGQGVQKAKIIDVLNECGNDIPQFEAKMNQLTSGQIVPQLQASMKFPINQLKLQSSIIIPQDQRIFSIFALQEQLKTDQQIPVGLINLGNSCFLNIIMQCFFNCVSFRNLILEITQPRTPNTASDFLKATQELFAQMQFGIKKYLDPSDFLAKLHEFKPEAALSAHEQNDYNEALVLLLDAFEEAMKETDNKQRVQLFHSMFIGKAQESLICSQQTVRVSQTEFTSISVQAKEQHLKSAFRASCQLIIEDYLPGKKAQIIQNIVYAPQVLQFHMNRVSYNTNLQELQKTNCRCDFSDNINFDEFLIQKSIIKQTDLEKLLKEKQLSQEKMQKLDGIQMQNLDNLIQIAIDWDLDVTSKLQPKILYQQLVILKDEFKQKKIDLNQQLLILNAQIDKLQKEKKLTNNYILTGVLIHSGNAQYGHYYCYLKQGNNWWKFNDRLVFQVEYAEVYRDAQGEINEQNNVVGLIFCKDMPQPLQLSQINSYLKSFLEKEKDKFLTEIDREIVMSLKNIILQNSSRYQNMQPRNGASKDLQHLVYPEAQIKDPVLKSFFIKFQVCKYEIEGNRRLHCPLKKFDYLRHFITQSGIFGSYTMDQIVQITQPYEELSQRILSIKLEDRITDKNIILMAERFEQLCAILQEIKDDTALKMVQTLYNAILLKGIFFIDLIGQRNNYKLDPIKQFARPFYAYINQIQAKRPFIYPNIRNQLSSYFQDRPDIFKQISIFVQKGQTENQIQMTPVAFLNALDAIDQNTKLWQDFVKEINEGKFLKPEDRLSKESLLYFDES